MERLRVPQPNNSCKWNQMCHCSRISRIWKNDDCLSLRYMIKQASWWIDHQLVLKSSARQVSEASVHSTSYCLRLGLDVYWIEREGKRTFSKAESSKQLNIHNLHRAEAITHPFNMVSHMISTCGSYKMRTYSIFE